MPFKVQVGPPQIAIHQAMTVLVTEPDGQIEWPTDKGLYFFDTRLISAWSVYANGEPWDLLSGGAVSYDAARIFLTNRSFLTEDGAVPAHSLAFVLSRAIDGGLHEDLDITNHGQRPVRFNLEIAIRSDFADIFEVKAEPHRPPRPHRHRVVGSAPAPAHARTATRDFMRAVSVSVGQATSRAAYANGRLSFEVDLAPGRDLALLPAVRTDRRRAAFPGAARLRRSTRIVRATRRRSTHWQQTVLKLRTSNEEFYRFYHQAIDDMAALRLPIEGTDHMVFVPAAGLPWFMAPFGRDSLIVSLQNILVYPEFARGSLDVLGRWQATERDDYRDAEPGKIMHELRYGELAHFKLIPHTPYYGTADATPLYLITLHAAWRATGDRRAAASGICRTPRRRWRWIDNYGDRDGDGFQEYQTRSPVGYENMAWKDAGDSMVYPDGTLVHGPKALCELQGYVYDAWLRMAEVFDALAQPDRARAVARQGGGAVRRIQRGVLGRGQRLLRLSCWTARSSKVLTVASNPGHLLWSGIVPPERAARVVARLMAPDMNSGWGIRTLVERSIRRTIRIPTRTARSGRTTTA